MAARRKPIRIHFQDRGQECLWWDLEPSSHNWVVVRSHAQGWLWNGSQVAKSSVGIGQCPVLYGRYIRSTDTAICVVKIDAIETRHVKAGRTRRTPRHTLLDQLESA